jgi:hypothetical protein
MTTSSREELFRSTAVRAMRALRMEPDAWQLDVMASSHKRLLLNCSRQAGKSTAVALRAVLEVIATPGSNVLLLAPSFRQSKLLFKNAARFLHHLGKAYVKKVTLHELHLANYSQIVALPCKEETIRGYANIHLLIIDEAARVPDDLFRAVCPMLAVADGHLICLSTPYGRGFFYEAWAQGGDDWQRIEVPVERVPRISADYLALVRRNMGDSYFRQEFQCSFEAMEGLVYPDFARCLVAPELLPPWVRSPVRGLGSWYGGIDFGLKNPFAAVWGVVDRDDVFWLVGEHYARNQPLAYHVEHLPRGVTWYADPSGAREIKELVCAGLTVRPADNERRAGLMAVRARLGNGTLRIAQGACPNLLAEAQLYRYDPDSRSEDPEKQNDHALDALRYVISKLDWKKLGQARRRRPPEEPPPATPAPNPPPSPRTGGSPAGQPGADSKRKKWLSIYNEALWTRVQ